MANVILCGFNWSGCEALSQLKSMGHNIYVFTHENDWHTPSLIDLCKKWNVPYSLEKISIDNLPFQPDVICSIYYRYIISKKVIASVDGKIFNLHPSLLPKYKGCSSLTWAMINGEKESGYTFHYLTSEVDKGDIIVQNKLEIKDFDTQETLYLRAMFEAMKDFNFVLSNVLNKTKGTPQENGGEYYSRGCPFDGEIDNSWSDDKKERFIRAMIYPPRTVAQFNGKNIYKLSDLKK